MSKPSRTPNRRLSPGDQLIILRVGYHGMIGTFVKRLPNGKYEVNVSGGWGMKLRLLPTEIQRKSGVHHAK